MTKRKIKPTATVEMAQALSVAQPGADQGSILDSLLAQVGANESTETDTKPTDSVAPIGDAIREDAIEAAVESIEREELYAAQGEKLEATEGAPETTKKKRKAKGEKTVKPVIAKTPKPPKEPQPPRVTFHGNSKSKVLDNRLGGQTADFLVLETGDALLDPADLAIKQADLKQELDTKIAKKVAEKCIMLFKWVKNGGKLNAVMRTAFEVLARDGHLTSGDKGNLQTELLKTYSVGTARSQANQVQVLFPWLKITVKTKGLMVPNGESVILASALQNLNLQMKSA